MSCESASSWSSLAPFGNDRISRLNASSQGARAGKWTCRPSILGVALWNRIFFSPKGMIGMQVVDVRRNS
jgi:hypothetical protein